MGARDRAGRGAPVAQAGQQAGVAGRDVAQDEVGVAGQTLGVRRHRQVGAELERELAERRGGRVVDRHQRAAGVGLGGDRRDVADVQAGVARRLEPDQGRLAGDAGEPRPGGGRAGHRDAEAGEVAVDQVAHPVVAVGRHGQRVAGAEHGHEDGRGRGLARAEDQGLAALEVAERALEGLPGGVLAAAVPVGDVRRVARQVERRRRDRDGVERLAGDRGGRPACTARVPSPTGGRRSSAAVAGAPYIGAGGGGLRPRPRPRPRSRCPRP